MVPELLLDRQQSGPTLNLSRGGPEKRKPETGVLRWKVRRWKSKDVGFKLVQSRYEFLKNT